MLWMIVVGCSGTPRSAPVVKSESAPEASAFAGRERQAPDLAFSALTDLFVRGEVAPPKALAGIKTGMPTADAVTILEAADPSGRSHVTAQVAGRTLDSALHVIEPPVRLYVVSIEDKVVALQVEAAFDPALRALGDLWGAPTMGTPTKDGKVTHQWTGVSWKARLVPTPDPPEPVPDVLKGRGVLEFTPAS